MAFKFGMQTEIEIVFDLYCRRESQCVITKNKKKMGSIDELSENKNYEFVRYNILIESLAAYSIQ